MSNQDLIGPNLNETLSGFVGMNHTDPVEGHAAGERAGTGLDLKVLITVESVARLIHQPERVATLSGTVDFSPTGE